MPSLFLHTLLGATVATMSVGAIAAAPVAATVASEEARAMDVLRAFDKLCNAPKLSFDILAERAKVTGMKPVPAPAPAPAAPAGMRLGRWGGTMPSGEFALLVDQASSVKGVLTTCAVAAEVGDADVFRAMAIKTMKLRANVKSDTSTEGGRVFDFGIVRPPSTRIVVRDFKPKGQNRILVSVSTLVPAPAR